MITRWILLLMLMTVVKAEEIYEDAPVYYSKSEPQNRLTVLSEILQSASFNTGTELEILARLLVLLEIPKESQVLVFSKTSQQNSYISASTPRALYFSDDAYVGYVKGGDIEVITFDQKLGMVFHRVNFKDLEGNAHSAKIIRDQSCLSCHNKGGNGQYPSLQVRSIPAQGTGLPLYSEESFFTDHHAPLSNRWGGWYVTGETDGQRHLGNSFSRLEEGEVLRSSVNIQDWVKEEDYLMGAQSDVLALMILEHQVVVHNAIVEGNLTAQITLHRHQVMQQAFGHPQDSPLSDINQGIIEKTAKKIVDALLFCGEFKMEEAGIEGSDSFRTAFKKNAKIIDGKSLKDLRLYERLFKYRCSYLIYSEPFSFLPEIMKSEVLSQLKAVLAGENRSADYLHLSDSERKKIFSILLNEEGVWRCL